MESAVIASSTTFFSTGHVTMSFIKVRVGDGTEYYEVGQFDTRPLDLRKHKWQTLVSNTCDVSARMMFNSATTLVGEQSRRELATFAQMRSIVSAVN